MTSSLLFYVVVAAILLVLGILTAGLYSFSRDREFRFKYSNKLMRARLAAQFVAVLLILLFIFLSSRGF